MNITFKSYWKTKSFVLIQAQLLHIHNSSGYRNVIYLGLLNFNLIISFKAIKYE